MSIPPSTGRLRMRRHYVSVAWEVPLHGNGALPLFEMTAGEKHEVSNTPPVGHKTNNPVKAGAESLVDKRVN